jgi:predicted RecB family nuclease
VTPPWTGPGHPDSAWGAFGSVCATLPADTEEMVWQRFLARVAAFEQRGTYCVYAYPHHEKTILSRLTAKHGGTPEFAAFTARFIDLAAVVREHIVFPTAGA